MLRKVLLTAGFAAALFAAPSAAPQPKLLMPSVTYERQVQFTLAGPVVIHVLTLPRPGGLWSLGPALSNDAVPGTEKVTTIQQRLSSSATVAGVNGDRFRADGRPIGILMRRGALEHAPLKTRSSIGLDSTGAVHIDRVALLGTWQGTGQRRPIAALNDAFGTGGVSLFTPAWGSSTPPAPGSAEAVLEPLPSTTPNVEIAGPVVQLQSGGSTPIPPDGAVLVARGAAAAKLQAEAPVGTSIRLRLILEPSWTGMVEALGGGPVLVRSRKAVFNAGEEFLVGQLAAREARTAIGQLRDGRIVLVATDGGAAGYSTGMSNYDLALTLLRLGAVSGAALDGGASTTMAFDGTLLNRPSARSGERSVSEALLVSYAGVQVPAPPVPVLSPNGDGVAEEETLAYKVVRPSTVSVNLIGPDGVTRYSFSGSVEPGIYPLTWNGRTEEGTPQPEGLWRWSVRATDDLGRPSSFQRAFGLNLTLGFPQAVGGALALPRPKARAVASFALARSARVATRIETLGGTVVRTLASRVQAPAGPLTVAWDGVTDRGGVAYSGRYAARVTATNEVGTVSLTSTFAVRRAGSARSSR